MGYDFSHWTATLASCMWSPAKRPHTLRKKFPRAYLNSYYTIPEYYLKYLIDHELYEND